MLGVLQVSNPRPSDQRTNVVTTLLTFHPPTQLPGYLTFMNLVIWFGCFMQFLRVNRPDVALYHVHLPFRSDDFIQKSWFVFCFTWLKKFLALDCECLWDGHGWFVLSLSYFVVVVIHIIVEDAQISIFSISELTPMTTRRRTKLGYESEKALETIPCFFLLSVTSQNTPSMCHTKQF